MNSGVIYPGSASRAELLALGMLPQPAPTKARSSPGTIKPIAHYSPASGVPAAMPTQPSGSSVLSQRSQSTWRLEAAGGAGGGEDSRGQPLIPAAGILCRVRPLRAHTAIAI